MKPLCPCGQPGGKSGFCQNCHCRNLGLAKANPNWKAEHDAMVRQCYAVKRRTELVKAISAMAARTGFNRSLIYARARRMGLTFIQKRKWTNEEVSYLSEHAGSVSVRKLAARLGRSMDSVLIQLARMGCSGRVVDGYTGEDIALLLGVGWATVKTWERRGLLKRHGNGRFSDEAVVRFVRRNPHEYDLRRVDQTWFKGLIFGNQVHHDFEEKGDAA